MKQAFPLLLCMLIIGACKNNGQNTSAQKAENPAPTKAVALKDLIIQNYEPKGKPDFQVLSWKANSDTLEVMVSYSGGCEEHDFNAYFSGGWLKSMPPQAVIQLEHLNPNNDACRSIVKDTLLFNLAPVRYEGQNVVTVKWSENAEHYAKYRYGKK